MQLHNYNFNKNVPIRCYLSRGAQMNGIRERNCEKRNEEHAAAAVATRALAPYKSTHWSAGERMLPIELDSLCILESGREKPFDIPKCNHFSFIRRYCCLVFCMHFIWCVLFLKKRMGIQLKILLHLPYILLGFGWIFLCIPPSTLPLRYCSVHFS